MSHVSSITASSYPYRTTLAEVDTNGDGIVSQQEIAVAQRPGLLKQDTGEQGDSASNSNLSSVLAMLLKMQASDTGMAARAAQAMGTTANTDAAANTQDDSDMQTSMAVYRNTYGLYDLDNVA